MPLSFDLAQVLGRTAPDDIDVVGDTRAKQQFVRVRYGDPASAARAARETHGVSKRVAKLIAYPRRSRAARRSLLAKHSRHRR